MITEHTDGAFAEYVLARAAGVLRLPEGLAPRHAALAEPMAVALHGITRSDVAPGDTVMVFGAGPIGALSIAALRSMGVTEITVVEPHEGRRRLAADLGADRGGRPGGSGGVPVLGARTHVVAGASTSSWSARDTGLPLRRASTNWAGAGSW